MTLARDEIALRILTAMIANSSLLQPGEKVGEKDIRLAFRVAEQFEQISDEVGARPTRQVGAGLGGRWSPDDDN